MSRQTTKVWLAKKLNPGRGGWPQHTELTVLQGTPPGPLRTTTPTGGPLLAWSDEYKTTPPTNTNQQDPHGPPHGP